ncbi:tetratricopeptide repeat protein [Aquipuribacter hungaricus]|uniref:Tetratricopeptide repeat protein n=1 Tax=Aquipuribacter hungaricus TaxID=545624 RepID=A0ABV7WC43_9MICO
MTDEQARGQGDGVRRPAGEVYDWLARGRDLLASGDTGAAATLLRHAHEEEPGSRELTETLARAEFENGRFAVACDLFASLVDLAPDSDYARFGLGASLVRLGRYKEALPHLTMATVMRPGRAEYEQLLQRARLVTGKGDRADG